MQSQAGNEIRLVRMGRKRLSRACQQGRHVAVGTVARLVMRIDTPRERDLAYCVPCVTKVICRRELGFGPPRALRQVTQRGRLRAEQVPGYRGDGGDDLHDKGFVTKLACLRHLRCRLPAHH